MTTKIYEYINTTPSGAYITTSKPALIRDYEGRGCWELEVKSRTACSTALYL